MPTGTSDGIEGVGDFTSLEDFMKETADGWKHQVEAAFDAWSAVADLTFVEVTDDGADFNSPTDPDSTDLIMERGDIRIGGHYFDGPRGVLAHGYFPPNNGLSAAGDIHFDAQDSWVIGFGGSGFDIFYVMAHEIGHAIGLGHETTESALMNPYYPTSLPEEILTADDIAGVHFIYGSLPAVPEPSTIMLIGLARFS